jgi:thiol-disulfide isomerase/thioredoxin
MRSRAIERACAVLMLLAVAAGPSGQAARAGQAKDPVAQAIADGELYESKKKYELALDAYHKADKLSHHTSAEALLKIALIEKMAGLLSDAANDAKKAISAAGSNLRLSNDARLMRATLLASMANKPTDNKLKEAEAELRNAIALEPSLAVAHFNLGMVLLKQERDTDGLAEMKTFLTLPVAKPSMASEARKIIANPIRARTPFTPGFSFRTRENETISNNSLRGKVVLLDFWGTWCPPCRESVPMLKNVQKKYAAKPFQLVGISSDDDEDVWKTFIQAQHMNWSEYLDSSSELQEAFNIDSFPTYIVVDKDGVIRFRQSGLSQDSQNDLEDAINKALKRDSDPVLAKAAAEGWREDTKGGADPEEKGDAAKAPAKLETGATRVTNAPPTSVPATPLLPVETATVTGNVYTNEHLGLRYEFPAGWKAAKPEDVHESNQRSETAIRALLEKQHPELAGSAHIAVPEVVFYASKRGDGEPQKPVLNSMRIVAQVTQQDTVNENGFGQLTARMINVSQLKQVGNTANFDVKGHKFLRADFERTNGALHYYQSLAQTVAGEYLLQIECFAPSVEELKQITDSLLKMEVKD